MIFYLVLWILLVVPEASQRLVPQHERFLLCGKIFLQRNEKNRWKITSSLSSFESRQKKLRRILQKSKFNYQIMRKLIRLLWINYSKGNNWPMLPPSLRKIYISLKISHVHMWRRLFVSWIRLKKISRNSHQKRSKESWEK